MSEVDKLIHQYDNRLQHIYDDRLAGAHTFTGVLAEFLWDYDRLCNNGGDDD